MAEHVAKVGRLPLLDALSVTGPPPATEAASGVRVRELFAGLALAGPVPDGPVLLVDDSARSTWTLTACAALLHDAGCGPVLPLVAHRRP
jgi:ATP-dependent DNA helicase RecQ